MKSARPMGCVAIGWPARSSAYRTNRTPFDGAPGTTAGSFASYWNVVAFHVYVVPNTTPGGKIEAAMAPLDGTSAARSAVAATGLSASERARRVTSVGWAARSSGRRAAIGLAAVGTYVVANEKLWNGREVKLVPSAWTLAAVASGSAGFFGWSGVSPPAGAGSAAGTPGDGRRERWRAGMRLPRGEGARRAPPGQIGTDPRLP